MNYTVYSQQLLLSLSVYPELFYKELFKCIYFMQINNENTTALVTWAENIAPKHQ